MTTNGDEDVPVTNGKVPSNDEDIEGSMQTSCDQCQKLQEELDHRQKDHAFYTALKKKISLTDSLIRKYNGKCQEFDQQQKKLEDVTFRLASTKRAYKVLEEQLTATLKEVIPWKRDKNKLVRELEECRESLRNTRDKLEGSEASCVQFKNGFLEMQGKLETMEDEHLDLKKATEKSQQTEKKVSALFAKNKEDLTACRKELKKSKLREGKLVRQQQLAKDKISELAELLRDSGLSVPRIPRTLQGGSGYCPEGTMSSGDTDIDQVDDVFSAPENAASPVKQVVTQPLEPQREEKDRSQLSQEKDACLKILDRFSCDLSSCMSPLPPSPQPPSTGTGVELMSDESDDGSRDDGSNNESFSDVANQIESQLNLCQGEGSIQNGSPDFKEETREKKRQLRQTPQRKARACRTLRKSDNALEDDSEDEKSRNQGPRKMSPRPNSLNSETKMPSLNRRPKSTEEGLSGTESSNENEDLKDDNHLQMKRKRKKRSTERQRKMEGEPCKRSTSEVSGRASLGSEKYQERHFDARRDAEISGLTSTLSEDSDDSPHEDVDFKRRQTTHKENINSLPSEPTKSPPAGRKRVSSSELDSKKSQEEAVAKQKVLLLSPDRRLTRAQFKTLTKQGTTGVNDVLALDAGRTKQKNRTTIEVDERNSSEIYEAQEKSSKLQTDATTMESNTMKVPSEQVVQDVKESPRRPITRSISMSENESLTESSPPSPVVLRRVLKSNSVHEGKVALDQPSEEGMHRPHTVLSGDDPKSPSRLSSRKLLRSKSLTDSRIDAEKNLSSSQDPKPVANEPSEDISNRLSRSDSVPGIRSVEAKSSHSEVLEAATTRRVTRSQVHASGNSNKEKMIPRRVTRSAAHNATSGTGNENLPLRAVSLAKTQPSSITNKDNSPHKGEDSRHLSDPSNSPPDNQKLSSGDAKLPEKSSSDHPPKKITKSLTSEVNGSVDCAKDVNPREDGILASRRVTRSLSFSEGKLNDQGIDLSGGHKVMAISAIQSDAEVDKSAPDSDDGELHAIKEERQKLKVDGPIQNAIDNSPKEVQTTQKCSDKPFQETLPTEDTSSQLASSKKSPRQGMNLTSSDVDIDRGTSDKKACGGNPDIISSKERDPPASNDTIPGTSGGTATVHKSGQGDGNRAAGKNVDPQDLPREDQSSHRKDPSSKNDVGVEIIEHQAAAVNENDRGTSVQEARGDAPEMPNDLTSRERLSIQGMSTSNDQGPSQVLCVEAESSRASTPTTNEIISINSMSGRISPVTPLPFQGCYIAKPLSPLSSPPQSPPVSPLVPSPLFLDTMVSIPRMLSPLPPSPVFSDSDSVDGIQQSALAEGVAGSSMADQPRMISPLFVTPVPPAVSPLPEAPMPNVLSPLGDTPPFRPGLVSTDLSPMISPLRNPLIPSPCNFHAEAPRDALSVRPQHYPASRRQPASRCLASSFTTTTAGMTQNPEIISPRLLSLASEMVFEFEESNPGTSGLHLSQQPVKAATQNSTQETHVGDQATNKENLQNLQAQNQSSLKRGFVKLHSKSSGSTFPKDSQIDNQPGAGGQEAVAREKAINSKSIVQKTPDKFPKEKQGMKSNRNPSEGENYNPPKTRSRNKQSSSQKNSQKSAGRSQHSKEEKEGLHEDDASVPLEDTSTSRRCTRSQAGSSRVPPLSSDHPGTQQEASSRLRRKSGDVEKDLESLSKKCRKRKASHSSDQEMPDTNPKLTTNQESDTQSIRTKARKDLPCGSTPKPIPSDITKPRKAVLIPSLELKTKGFKRSGSLKRRQEIQQEGEHETELIPCYEESGHSADKEIIRSGSCQSETSEKLGCNIETLLSANVIPVERKVDKKEEQGGSPKSILVSVLILNSTEGTPVEKITSKSPEQSPAELRPTNSSVGSQQKVAAMDVVSQSHNANVKETETCKSNKAKSKIGNIWGNIASQKDPGYHVFNRGSKSQRKKRSRRTEDWDSNQHHQISKETSQEVADNQTCLRAEDRSVVSLPVEPVMNSPTPQGQAALSQPASCQSAVSQVPQESKWQQNKPSISQTVVANVSEGEPKLAGRLDANWDSCRRIPVNTLVSDNAQFATKTTPKELTAQDPIPSKTGVSSAKEESRSGQRIAGSCPGTLAEEQLAGDALSTGQPPNSRKRHAPQEDSSSLCSIDEHPAPSKQLKLTPLWPSVESGSKGEHSAQESAPPSLTKGNALFRKPHMPILSDLARRIKDLRSQRNVKPLVASILAFLGQQSVNLMDAIQIECQAISVRASPMLLSHEEQLVACIVDSNLQAKKSNMGMLLSCLCRGVQNPPRTTSAKPAVVVGAAYCRVFAALGRKLGLIHRVRVFCYDLLREGFPNAEELLLNIAVAWPTVLRKKEGTSSPICSAMEMVTMQRLVLAAGPQNLQAQELMRCFGVICGWGIPEGSEPAKRCHQLVASMQDPNITKLCSTGTPTQALTQKTYEVVKAVELLAWHQGWQWTNNELIRDRLWPVLKKWSQEIQAATTGGNRNKPAGGGSSGWVQSSADASACAVMKVISGVACLGLNSSKQSVFELLKMLAAVLQQPASSVPWTVQVFTAEAILQLSPSNPTFALGAIQQWRQKMPITLPAGVADRICVLTKVGSALTN